MTTKITNTSHTLSLLPYEVKKQIISGNYGIIFNTKVDMKKRLFILLAMLGIPSNISGYDYIKDTLMLGISNNYKIPAISKNLYPKIAKNYNKNPAQIERCIRHAITKSMDRASGEILYFIFGETLNSLKYTPTNSEYITQILKFLESMCN